MGDFMMRRVLGSALIIMGAAGTAMALYPVVPEIDAASGATAVGLLIGGLLIIRARTRR
jgi:hypothetical protein